MAGGGRGDGLLFVAVQQTSPGPLRVPGTERRGRTGEEGKRLAPETLAV